MFGNNVEGARREVLEFSSETSVRRQYCSECVRFGGKTIGSSHFASVGPQRIRIVQNQSAIEEIFRIGIRSAARTYLFGKSGMGAAIDGTYSSIEGSRRRVANKTSPWMSKNKAR